MFQQEFEPLAWRLGTGVIGTAHPRRRGGNLSAGIGSGGSGSSCARIASTEAVGEYCTSLRESIPCSCVLTFFLR